MYLYLTQSNPFYIMKGLWQFMSNTHKRRQICIYKLSKIISRHLQGLYILYAGDKWFQHLYIKWGNLLNEWEAGLTVTWLLLICCQQSVCLDTSLRIQSPSGLEKRTQAPKLRVFGVGVNYQRACQDFPDWCMICWNHSDDCEASSATE